MKTLYQTDFDGHIKDDGCLMFCLIKVATLIAGKSLSEQKCITLLDFLFAYINASYDYRLPVISNEDDTSLPGVFVWDHATACNETLQLLGSDRRVAYTGRIYMPWEVERGKTSFGTNGGDFCILQILTANGNGHFRMLDYEPWEPGTKMAGLKSLRWYKVVK